MTAITSSLVWRCGNAVENYNWIKAVSDALTAAGVVLTADTGQINLGTGSVALPTINATNTSITPIGYQIRKLEKTGLPTLYIRIDYGYRRTNTFPPIVTDGNIPVITINVSTSTDGAGTLNGFGFQFTANSSAGHYLSGSQTVATAPSVFPRAMYVSSDGKNYLTITIDPGCQGALVSQTSSNMPMVFCLERTADATTFAYDADGAVMFVGGGDSPGNVTLYQFQWFSIWGSHRNQMTSGAMPVGVPVGYTQSPNGDVQLFPVFVTIPTTKAPMRSMVYYYSSDLSPGGFVQADLFGETRTFIAAGVMNYASLAAAVSYARPAVRFD